MTPMDWGLLLLLFAFVANGVWQGMMRQLAALLGLILGLVVATVFYQPLSRLLAGMGPLPWAVEPFAWVLLLLGCWIVANLLGFMARRRAQDADAGWVDPLGGALLGLIAGVLILGAVVSGSVVLGLPFAQQVETARIGVWLLRVFGVFIGWMGD